MSRSLDWAELSARLSVMGQTRMALAHAGNYARGGGFDPDCARALGTFASLSDGEALREYDYPTIPIDVNRVDSGRGKSRSAITGSTAGNDTTGDRGLK